jgi:cathepsin H
MDYRYQKVYKSLGEIKHRFATFLENLELIEATNKKKLSYTLGINGVN